MIGFGQSFEGDDDKLPKEVAEWLLSKSKDFPQVRFEVQRWKVLPQGQDLVEKYSRCFLTQKFEKRGIEQISFLYRDTIWNVSFIGGADETGRPLSREEEKSLPLSSLRPLPADLLNKIADFYSFPELVKVDRGTSEPAFCLPRKAGEEAQDSFQNFVSVRPDYRF
jgi:hypothetical protein